MQPHADQPVFVAEHRWRERAVRAVLALLAALLIVWLLALIAGALGLGSLPPLPISAGGDSDSAGSSSRSESPGGHARAAPVNGTAAQGSPTASRPAGQPDAVPPTGQAAHGSEDAPASVVANAGVDSHSAAKGSGGGGQATAGEPAPQHVRANGKADEAAGSVPADATAQPAAHGPPARTPSGNEVPGGTGGAPSAKGEALAESPGSAHGGASETRRPG